MKFFLGLASFVVGVYSVSLHAETPEHFSSWSEAIKLACSNMANAHERIVCFHDNTINKSKEDGSLVMHSVDYVCSNLDHLQEQCYKRSFDYIATNPPPWIHEEYSQNLSGFALTVCQKLQPDPNDLKTDAKKNPDAARAESAEFGYNRAQCFGKVADMSPEISKVFLSHQCRRNSDWASDCHQSSLVQYLSQLNDAKKSVAHNLQPPLRHTN